MIPSLGAGLAAGFLVFAAWIGYFGWGSTNLMEEPAGVPAVKAMAYTGYGRWGDPQLAAPDVAQVAKDLEALQTATRHLRIYSSTEVPDLPTKAKSLGIEITAGAWLDARTENNQRELSLLIQQTQRFANIRQVVVGNETLLLQKLDLRQLLRSIEAVKAQVRVPVSTAEPWHVWLQYPELVSRVDFMTVHILPYWEGVAAKDAVTYALQRLAQLQQRFPGKRIVIGEFGWPSAGPARGAAVPSPVNQAQVVNEFIRRMQSSPHEYFLMEAVDQPWKESLEGRVGAHWGWLDAARQPKFSLSAGAQTRGYWRTPAIIAAILTGLVVGLVTAGFGRWLSGTRIGFFAITACLISMSVWAVAEPLRFYLKPWQVLGWVMVVLAVLMGLAVLLVLLIEALDVHRDQQLSTRLKPRRWTGLEPLPLVSVHLACSNEPAHMVIEAIDSVLAQGYPFFELVVIDNNTVDSRCWQPVQAHVLKSQQAGKRVVFEHHRHLDGFKAGALNRALSCTSPEAQYIAVIDADYLVSPDWLESVMGHFQQSDIALVQCPQAHRQPSSAKLARWMNAEYEGFFAIGMHHRHERNAIIQHGTMCVVRRSCLHQAGGWSDHTVCEDAELGLRLLMLGTRAAYLDLPMGHGLLPENFSQYGKQRRRWAMGAMQICRLHWRSLLSTSSTIRWGQRYHFLAGWFPWLGEALHLLMVLSLMLWTLAMLLFPQWVGLPDPALVILPLVFFVLRLLLGFLAHQRHSGCDWGDSWGGSVAAMALSLPIAKGVLAGLFTADKRFEVTRKAGTASPVANPDLAREASVLTFGLAVCSVGAMSILPGIQGEALPALLWSAMLLVLALPYAAAWACCYLPAGIAQVAPLWHTSASRVLRDANEAE